MRRYYGVDQYWTRVIDYGFRRLSRNRFRIGLTIACLRCVRVVRMVRPLVITSVSWRAERWSRQSPDAGAMAQEAFKAAAIQHVSGADPLRTARVDPAERYARAPGGRRGGGAMRRG